MKSVAVALMFSLLGMSVLSAAPLDLGDSTLPSHPANACSFPHHVQGGGWDFCWQQDDVRAQGVELNQVYFQGKSMIWKIGFPFSITRYEDNVFGPFKDTLGQSTSNSGFGRGSMQIHPEDCPRFLGTGALLNDRRICVESRDGPESAVAIWARYDVFNYRFLQGYIMDSRGVMEPFVRLGGTLIDGNLGEAGANHFHHLYWRIDFEIGEPGNDGFQNYMRPPDDWKQTGSLKDFPEECRDQVRAEVAGWCDVKNETRLIMNPELSTKWRVQDPVDQNVHGNARSFEFYDAADTPVDHDLTTFDVLGLEHQGDSQEIGFEVPLRPLAGDSYLEPYFDPPEKIVDPVTWVATHAYHDTRDEERPTLSYHHISFTIGPRNFMGENPGEDSYDRRTIPGPPGIIVP